MFSVGRAAVLSVSVLLVTTGCVETQGSKEATGTMIGVAAGGLIGSQFGDDRQSRVTGGILGAMVGGFIGNRIGAYLDEQERARLASITRQTAITGSSKSFTAKSSGAKVSTKAKGERVNALGDTCRTVEQRAVLRSGDVVVNSVEACRDKKTGAWNI